MRISTASIYEAGTSRMSELQAALQKSQQQIATGRRLLTAADDPVAAARALEVTQGQSINNQFAVNRKTVQASISQEENTLQGVTNLLQDIREVAVKAGNGAYDASQLKFMAAELKGQFDQLMGLANSRDPIGNYIFSGFQTNTQPFAESPTGALFNGDNGQRVMQVATTRQMATSDSGESVFTAIRTGNGQFVTSPVVPATNTGSGIISPGTVTGAISQDNFQIVFSDGGATYSVFNTTLDPSMSDPPESTGAYVPGQYIAIDGGGRQIDIKGTPADGDAFTIEPSRDQSIFTTIKNLIGVLDGSSNTNVGRTVVSNGLVAGLQNIDNALDNVLTVRASVGARLKELETLDSEGDGRNLLFAQTLRDLQDLDYVKAISDLSQQTITLEAAQKSFIKVTGLSLFNFI